MRVSPSAACRLEPLRPLARARYSIGAPFKTTRGPSLPRHAFTHARLFSRAMMSDYRRPAVAISERISTPRHYF